MADIQGNSTFELMKGIRHPNFGQPERPRRVITASLGKILSAVLVAVIGGIASYYLVSLRGTRLEAEIFPPLYKGRPAGNFVIGRGSSADHDKLEEIIKHPQYAVTLTNVSQQTLFRCHPTVAPLTDDGLPTPEASYDSIDLKSAESRKWTVSGPGDGKGTDWPVSVYASCTYYDAFGFRHVIKKILSEIIGTILLRSVNKMGRMG